MGSVALARPRARCSVLMLSVGHGPGHGRVNWSRAGITAR